MLRRRREHRESPLVTGSHPVCRRPDPLGSGPPPGPPRQADLDGSCGRWRVGRWSARLARVDGRRDGLPQPLTDRNPPMVPRPSWSRSAPAGGAIAATPPGSPARRRGRRALPTPRGLVAARPGRLPAHPHRSTSLSFCGSPVGFSLPRQPPGVLRGQSRSASGATDARPGGGACGPFRAALRTYRSLEHGLLPRPKQSVSSDDCFDGSA